MDGDQRIVTFDLPPSSPLTSVRLLWPILVVLFFVVPAGTIAFTFALGSAARANSGAGVSSPFTPFVLFALGMGATLIVFYVFNCRRLSKVRRRQWDDFVTGQGGGEHAVQLESLMRVNRWGFGRRQATWNKMSCAVVKALRTSHNGSIAFIPSKLAKQLESHKAPPGLLEPEPIGHSFSWAQGCAMVFPLLLVGNSFVSRRLHGVPWGWLDLLLAVSLGVLGLSAVVWCTSVLGEKVVALKSTKGIVKAGPGWIDSHTPKRRWTVEDSVLIVRAMTPSPRTNYQAFLLGPQGMLMIPIAKGTGPAFINLWQRWTTPEPRLDLAE